VQTPLNRTPLMVSAAMLIFGGIASLPYGFYQFLRLMVCGTAIYVALNATESNRSGWAWTMGGIALLFNPIFIVRLTRDEWRPIDIVIGVAFVVAAVAMTDPNRHHTSPD